MKLMQKGQSMVEFAVIFPFFIFLIMALAYFGLAFADFLYLNNIARSSAREAIVCTNVESEAQKSNDEINRILKPKYDKIKVNYEKNGLISDIYKWTYYDIRYDKNTKNVIVKIKATLNTDDDSLPSIMDRLLNVNSSDAFDINIEYTMYKG